MPKRKIQRTLEEDKEFQRQRRERKAENQRRYRQNAKIINNISNISVDNKNHIMLSKFLGVKSHSFGVKIHSKQ